MRNILALAALLLVFSRTAQAQSVILWAGEYPNNGGVPGSKPIVGHFNDAGGAVDNTYFQVPMPAGTLTAFDCKSNQPGTGNSMTWTIQKNGSNTSATCTYTHPTSTCSWTGTLAVAKDDYLSYALTVSGTTAIPTDCMASFTPTALAQGSAGLNNFSAKRDPVDAQPTPASVASTEP